MPDPSRGVARPELACIVLSLRDEPGLVRAVQSVLGQSERVEVSVVNSGGGDPARRLRAAGLGISVIDRPRRLYPGAVRNLGIEATSARYVAFLAADCVAEPGWAAARLSSHRAGAHAVAGAITNPFPHSRSACASHLLLHHRRMPGALEDERLLYSLSYERWLFDRFGRFREDLQQDEDTEFNARLGPECKLVWNPRVRAAHLYPDRFLALLRDQWARGRRRATVSRAQWGPWRPRYTAVGAFRNTWAAVEHVRRVREPDGRELLRHAAPLLGPAVLAYVGGLTSEGLKGRLSDRLSYPRPRGIRRSSAPRSSVR
jgi:glycosyltransferase involved in cell wall biosynthesis